MTYNLPQALERLLYHGEFAGWLNDQEMPLAAAKELEEFEEFEEFERMVDALRDTELRVDCKR